MDNSGTTDLFDTPSYSARGIVAFALPLMVLFGVGSQLTDLITTRVGSLFLYCLSPALLISGFILSILELNNQKRKKLLPILGIVIALVAAAPMILIWLLGLMQGAPFSCLDNPSFCGW